MGVTCKGRFDKPFYDSVFTYPVHRLPDKKWRNNKYRYIARRLKSLSQDCDLHVLAGSWKMGLGVARYNILNTRIPYIVQVNGKEARESRFFNRMLKNYALKSSCLITTGAENVKKIIYEDVDHPVEIVHHGVDMTLFKPLDVPQEFYAKYRIPADRPKLLGFGRFVKRKGFDMVLEAMPRIVEKVPELVLVLAGRGPEEENLRRSCAEKGLGSNVIFTGFIDDEDTVLLYNACDVYIMPSRAIGNDIEGFGITYIEANSCGKPVIGGNSGGVPDAVDHGESGFLVDPESSDDIADRVIELFTDNKLRDEMGRKALNRVERDFQWKDIVRNYVQLFGIEA